MPPLPTEYERPLDDEHLNWVRVRFITVRGRVLSFVVQYEATVNDMRVPIVRFGTAHGRPHRDQMFLNGRQEKLWLPEELSYNQAMRIAENDIESNWKRYREAFYRGYV